MAHPLLGGLAVGYASLPYIQGGFMPCGMSETLFRPLAPAFTKCANEGTSDNELPAGNCLKFRIREFLHRLLLGREGDGEGISSVLDHPDANRLREMDVVFPRQHRPGVVKYLLPEALIFDCTYQNLLLNGSTFKHVYLLCVLLWVLLK